MNNRIRKLAEEARLLTGWPVGEVEYQKFAELIITKCCSIADDWVNNYNDGENYPSERIKEHFGRNQ
jgi:hypothetical protein